MKLQELYRTALEADLEYIEALEAQYGKHAQEMRTENRGHNTRTTKARESFGVAVSLWRHYRNEYIERQKTKSIDLKGGI